MSKHTPEPWKLYRNDQSVGDARGYAVCDVWPRGDGSMASDEGKANARRIVACVNACRGLPTEELEQKGLVAAVGTQLLEADELSNELLTTLEALAECYCEAGNELSKSERAHHRAVYRDALSAIEKAKTKGGAA